MNSDVSISISLQVFAIIVFRHNGQKFDDVNDSVIIKLFSRTKVSMFQ